MTRYIALLRGINVGGRHRLPMADLRDVLASCGCKGAKTLIQSGNAVFSSPLAEAPLAATLAGALEAHLGFAVPVILRPAGDFAAPTHPLATPGAADKNLHVGFLAAPPTPEAVAGLDPNRSPPDQFLVQGRNVYLHFPNGSARTKLTSAWFDRNLGGPITVRNWRTVSRLRAMGGSSP